MPLEAIVGCPPLAASRTTQPLTVAVCGLLAASLFGSGLSGVRPWLLVCADTNAHDSTTAAHVAPNFALLMSSSLKKSGRCNRHQLDRRRTSRANVALRAAAPPSIGRTAAKPST